MSGPNTSYDPVEVAVLDPTAIDDAVEAALAAAAAATDLDELKTARTAHQGDKSPLALANREIGALPPTAKAEAGKRVGQAKGRVAQAFTTRQAELEAERDERILTEEAVDVTLPTGRRPLGRRHPIELMSQRIADLFVGMGWEIAEGPEIEAEWFNFDALNFDADHPARQMQDTFYVDPPEDGLVLRTHTSPVQARTLLERGVPVYVAAIGRVFRTDELDATHMPAFHQVEGLAVDEGITMAHLKGTLDRLAAELFGDGITTR
ncbi:MAG TPA: phenylalanine--tRNA ligase subunit alpha, partial [Nocardioides sp.]|nr:phenylalanine--tRNA ligase subunit alpha [Nocardioides sp.]